MDKLWIMHYAFLVEPRYIFFRKYYKKGEKTSYQKYFTPLSFFQFVKKLSNVLTD